MDQVDIMGIFGNSASIFVDLNLIAQMASLVLLIVGYTQKRSLKRHGRIMSTVTLITLIFLLLIMAPSLVLGFNTYGPTILLHAGVGSVATLLGLLFSVRFNKAVRAGKPLACGKKNMMRLTFILWLFPILGGINLYITRYITG